MTKEREALKLALEALEDLGMKHYESTGEVLYKETFTAIKEALAQPEQDGVAMADYMALVEKYVALKAAQPKQKPVEIEWTLDGDKSCGYNNWVGNTPFGRILITWKGWKEYHDACVDEFPGEFYAYGTPDEVKAECEAEFARRSNTTPPQRKPLTDEEIDELWELWLTTKHGSVTKTEGHIFARAIEAKLKEKNT